MNIFVYSGPRALRRPGHFYFIGNRNGLTMRIWLCANRLLSGEPGRILHLPDGTQYSVFPAAIFFSGRALSCSHPFSHLALFNISLTLLVLAGCTSKK